MRVKITLKQLEACGACQDGIAAFLRLYPDGIVELDWSAETKLKLLLNPKVNEYLGWFAVRNLIPDLNFKGANLQGANLRGTDLKCANFRGSNLRGVDLQGANLWDVDLLGADLRDANLRGAYLVDANLQGVNLLGTDLRGADLSGVKF